MADKKKETKVDIKDEDLEKVSGGVKASFSTLEKKKVVNPDLTVKDDGKLSKL